MLLIIGLMIGSITSALVSVLQFFSGSEAIKKYLLWTMGSLTSVDKYELLLFIPFIIIGFIGALLLVNPLNALLLGDEQARSLGIEVKKIKTVTIIITGLLAGTVTAFCGPVAFIGLAAPHIAKIISKTSNHRVLLPLTALIGANILLFSDLVSQLPGFDTMLPINAVTSLIGAPIVIYIIIRDRKLKYD
jgi:iron complex transport system permease protein